METIVILSTLFQERNLWIGLKDNTALMIRRICMSQPMNWILVQRLSEAYTICHSPMVKNIWLVSQDYHYLVGLKSTFHPCL